jgi:outer membrane receptor protein involved in Fe transport
VPGLLEPGGAAVNYARGTSSESYSNNDSREAALTLDYQLGSGASLTSVTAWSSYKLDELCDCDFVAAPLITAGIQEDYNQYSQELRLTSAPGNRINWIGGLYFQRYELDESDYLQVPTNSLVPGMIAQSAAPLIVPALQQPGAPCEGLDSSQCLPIARAVVDSFFRGASNPRDFTQDSTLYSVFLQGGMALSDKWSFNLGGRLSQEKKDGRRNTSLLNVSQNPITSPLAHALYNQVLGIVQHDVSGSRKETSFSPLVNLQYRYSDRSMAYLSFTQGYKSGGFDARSNKPPTAGGTFEYADERATAYELGLKTGVGARAEINIAAFHTDYQDLQTSAFDGSIGFNVGNGSAEVRGLELEGRWRPAGALLLKGSLAALDFEWKDYQGQCYYDLLVSGCASNQDYSGRDNQFAPSFTGVLSAEYAWNLGLLVALAKYKCPPAG